jgi:PleD family two-component response regulator
MAHKSTFALRPLGARKRVLLVATNRDDCEQRSEFLRRRGYEVDCASSTADATAMSRVHSYDIIVLPIDLDCESLDKLGRKLQRQNPNATITCLADCKKPLPSLPGHCLLWKGEPLEYFLARMEALATTA